MSGGSSVEVNERTYRLPRRPTVVVCIDGGEPEYFDRAVAAGVAPAIARFRAQGVSRLARGVDSGCVDYVRFRLGPR